MTSSASSGFVSCARTGTRASKIAGFASATHRSHTATSTSAMAPALLSPPSPIVFISQPPKLAGSALELPPQDLLELVSHFTNSPASTPHPAPCAADVNTS